MCPLILWFYSVYSHVHIYKLYTYVYTLCTDINIPYDIYLMYISYVLISTYLMYISYVLISTYLMYIPYVLISTYLMIYHHHHIALVERISLTLSRHSSLSFIALGRSLGQHPVSSHSC